MNMKRDGIKAIRRGNILEGSQSPQDRAFILSPGRSPRSPDFPTLLQANVLKVLCPCRVPWTRTAFLLLVSNMGRFPELTPVCRQTTEAWLPTLGASDRHDGQQCTAARWATPRAAAHGSATGNTMGSSAQRCDRQHHGQHRVTA